MSSLCNVRKQKRWAAGSWQLAVGVFVSLIVVFVISIPAVFAQGGVDLGMFQLDDMLRLPDSDPRTIAVRLINVSLQFVGVLMLVMVLWGGVLFMFSGGKDENVKKATAVLKNAIIGLIIVLSAWGIVRFVLTEFIAATGGVSTSARPFADRQLAAGSWQPADCADGVATSHQPPATCLL